MDNVLKLVSSDQELNESIRLRQVADEIDTLLDSSTGEYEDETIILLACFGSLLKWQVGTEESQEIIDKFRAVLDGHRLPYRSWLLTSKAVE